MDERKNGYDLVSIDHEADKIRNNCRQSIVISLVAIVISVAVLVTNVIFG